MFVQGKSKCQSSRYILFITQPEQQLSSYRNQIGSIGSKCLVYLVLPTSGYLYKNRVKNERNISIRFKMTCIF